MEIFIIGFCILWMLLCGRVWWTMNPRNRLQRRLVAIGTGLGAALFYYGGMQLWRTVQVYQEAAEQAKHTPSSEDVRISLPKGK
jgi:hypothetical protein